ncbi:DUF721 domain-containing protein [Rothia aerolata]|uniref:DUF721 domain-containing protein n=1 Tax=Rothia aerolata TaxID=1812262 RepID=A0A917IZX7_9MICC|nr:DciA family protein [Rothia aerolata]GGH66530.1 hypothetical protein GCM10007359_20780 [Rothia aerolata]
MNEYDDPYKYEDVVDAPASLLNRLRVAAAQRGEGRLTGRAAQKILRDFGSVMTAEPGAKKTRRFRDEAYDPRVLGGYSSAGRSTRDPKPLGELLNSMIASRGWKEPVAVSSVLARWDQLMGSNLAQHAHPEGYQDSTVTIRCDSTAWATQVKLMRGEILAMFERELGQGVVTKLVIRGPHAPSWKRGRFVAPGGRGPRDTYG